MASVRSDDEPVAHTMQEGTKRVSEQTENLIRNAAKAAARNATASEEAIERAAEPFQQTFGSVAKTISQATERTAEQFVSVLDFSGDQAERVRRESAANIDALAKSTSVAAEGVQTVVRECLTLSRNRIENNAKQWERLLSCRSLNDLVAAQTEAMRENFEQTLRSVRRLAEISLQTTDQASKQMSETLERTRRVA